MAYHGEMKFVPSPNFNDRRGQAVRHLILHYTGMQTAAAALDRLCHPAAEVSAHYLVDTAGEVIQLVHENARAWHAGVSFWAGETDINASSMGIEIVNPGHEFGYVDFPQPQISALIDLCHDILSRHKILPRYILAHSDIAPARKMDPGELFPWATLAQQGIGLFPGVDGLNGDDGTGLDATALSDYGYDICDLPAAITAFQRHFRPVAVNGVWDGDCSARLAGLLARVHETRP